MRGREGVRYRYSPPPALDDGWAVASLESVGISRPAIEAFIQKLIDMKPEAGGSQIHSVLIARHGKLVLEEYFHGHSRDQTHDIRSAGKSFTSILIGAAMLNGVPIREDTPVYRAMFGQLPAEIDPRKRGMTLRHLLTHTSGMAEATEEEERAATKLADLIPAYASKPVQFEPGSKWQYCQSGINTLARIVEVVSGKSFSEFLDERIFGPLGMKDTTFYPTAEQMSRIVKAYAKVDGKLEEAPVFILGGKPITSQDRYPAANGGLFSTATDYARFCQMILNGGTLDGKRYLKAESVKLMTSVQSGDLKTGFTDGNGWGLGWCIVRRPQGVTGMLSAGTHGHGGAFGTQGWIDPVKGTIYILMVQRANFPNSDASEVRRAFQEAAEEGMK
jgi:CubicO group peptidase (beta-lactamase class C family)